MNNPVKGTIIISSIAIVTLVISPALRYAEWTYEQNVVDDWFSLYTNVFPKSKNN